MHQQLVLLQTLEISDFEVIVRIDMHKIFRTGGQLAANLDV